VVMPIRWIDKYGLAMPDPGRAHRQL